MYEDEGGALGEGKFLLYFLFFAAFGQESLGCLVAGPGLSG
jgi:hypothetical protein